MTGTQPITRPSERTGVGAEAFALMERLFPLCRSLTGAGVRATLDILAETLELRRTEIPSGTPIFDWRVPDEWNIGDAYIARNDGTRVVDLQESSLHVVSYSEPVRARMPLALLRPRLHALPEQPDLVPYRTSYYERTWGFCLSQRRLDQLEESEEYEVVIDATLGPGHLTYGEVLLPGERTDEVLISTYICHPSLANDNLSGIAVAAMVARELAQRRRRLSYRILFAPGTIGPLAWLHENRAALGRIRHGLTVSCIGDPGPLTYKRSRRATSEIDLATALALRDGGAAHRIVDWEPWGGDERQFCSPGFNLPVGCLMRTPHGAFPGYHTSADSLERISPDALAEAVEICLATFDILETDGRYRNLSPYGEPQLGRRGLYRSAGGAVHTPRDERALLWVLNLSDGRTSLREIASRAGLPYTVIHRAAGRLARAELLAAAGPPWTETGRPLDVA